MLDSRSVLCLNRCNRICSGEPFTKGADAIFQCMELQYLKYAINSSFSVLSCIKPITLEL